MRHWTNFCRCPGDGVIIVSQALWRAQCSYPGISADTSATSYAPANSRLKCTICKCLNTRGKQVLFVLSKLAWPFLTPSNVLALLVISGTALLWSRRSRLGRMLIGLAALFVLCAGFLPAGTWLLVMLERRFPQIDPPNHVDGIIVLGGAEETGLSLRFGRVVLNDNSERLLALAELQRRYPDAVVVYAGNSPAHESDVAEQALAQMGANTSRIVFERRSRNTRENAVYAHDLVAPTRGQVWLLVTSAYHMPRAVAVFRALSWPVIPYPVDPRTTGRFDFEFWLDWDVASRLEATDFAVREYLGLLAYRLFGWTNELFPAKATEARP